MSVKSAVNGVCVMWQLMVYVSVKSAVNGVCVSQVGSQSSRQSMVYVSVKSAVNGVCVSQVGRQWCTCQ